MSDIEGKAERVAASERGRRVSSIMKDEVKANLGVASACHVVYFRLVAHLILVRQMRALVVLALMFGGMRVCATQVVDPPINTDTIVGVWEALWCQNPATLWRMEINKSGDSFLAQITVGSSCVVRRLLSSEISEGKVKLHFEAVRDTKLRDVELPEIWIVGSGEATVTRGGIDAGDWHFVKGAWTRDVAEASKKAEESIRERAAKK